jgi:hypothetical protein
MNEEDVIDDNDLNNSPFTSNSGIISNIRKTNQKSLVTPSIRRGINPDRVNKVPEKLTKPLDHDDVL